jgi:ribonuclease D
LASIAAARLGRQDEDSDHAELAGSFRDFGGLALPPLTIAQERALLRLKSVRLSMARKKRCAPARIATDDVLYEIARAEPVSQAAIRNALMRQKFRDEALVQAMFEALQHEVQNA